MKWEAPAKLNLSLHVKSPRTDGLHPLESMVQTVDWCDRLTVVEGDGQDILDSDIEDNLILVALRELRRSVHVPPLTMSLDKVIPTKAGLGGGSSDAAAALKAAAEVADAGDDVIRATAANVGSDVATFLHGGTSMMTGVGETIEKLRPLRGFAVAIVVPDFGLSTADVYRRWDEMEGPTGDEPTDDQLPPPLRGAMPMRNDLLPAALDLEPRLGDFMADLRSTWGGAVFMTGSGSGCFGYFADVDEAASAAAAVGGVGRGVGLRSQGVFRVDQR